MSDRRALSAVVGLLVATLAILRARARARDAEVRAAPALGQSPVAEPDPHTPTSSTTSSSRTATRRTSGSSTTGSRAGKFYGKYDIPFIDRSKLFILWRGVYDSIYDTTPGFIEKDGHPRARRTSGERRLRLRDPEPTRHRPRGSSPSAGSPARSATRLKFENTLREAYVDLKFRGIPLSVRAGKQQIVWGETDNFRMLDRANTLDLTWHFQQEIPPPAFGWDEIRRPFWMLKFLYDLGDVVEALAELPRVVLEPGRLVPGEAGLPAAPVGPPLLQPAHQPGRRRLQPAAICADRAAATSRNCTPAHERHEALRAGRLRPQPAGEQPGRRPLPRHRALRARVHPQLLLPALRRATTAPTTRRSAACPKTDAEPWPSPSTSSSRRASSRPSSTRPTCTRSAARPTTPTRPTRRRSSASRRSTTSASRSSTSAKETVIDRPLAPRHHEEEHVEGHARLRPADVDPLAQQEEHGLPHRAVLLAPPRQQPELRAAGRGQPDRRAAAGGGHQLLPRRRPRPPVERPHRRRQPGQARLPRQGPRLGDALHVRAPSPSTAAAASSRSSASRSIR